MTRFLKIFFKLKKKNFFKIWKAEWERMKKESGGGGGGENEWTVFIPVVHSPNGHTSQEPRTGSRSPVWGLGQVFEPPFSVFSGVLNYTGSRAAGTRTGAHIAGGSSALCFIMLSPFHSFKGLLKIGNVEIYWIYHCAAQR